MKLLVFGGLIGIFLTVLVQTMTVGRDQAQMLSDAPRDESSNPSSQAVVPAQADLVVFFESSCAACRMAHPWIDKIAGAHSGLQVAWIDLEHNSAVNNALEGRYLAAYHVQQGVPRPLPVLFIGSDWLAGPDAVQRALPASVARYMAGASPPPLLEGSNSGSLRWAPLMRSAAAASVGPSVALVALVFLSVLALAERRRGAVWAVGGVFLLSAWATGCLAGLGLFHSLYTQESFPAFEEALYPAAALAVLGMAASILFNLRAELRHLPAGTLAPLAGGVAVVISMLEFAGAARGYLPALLYHARLAPDRGVAVAQLAVYEAIYLLPLLLLLAAIGPGRAILATRPSAARFRTPLAGAFAVAGLYLTFVSLRQYGLL